MILRYAIKLDEKFPATFLRDSETLPANSCLVGDYNNTIFVQAQIGQPEFFVQFDCIV
jgi:hypothetical protein